MATKRPLSWVDGEISWTSLDAEKGPLMDQLDDLLGSLLGLRKDTFEFHCHRDLT